MGTKKITAVHCISGKPLELLTDGDRLISIRETGRAGRDALYVGPGLTDAQVNGYGGVDFNTLPLSPSDVRRACRGLLAHGVTRFFPTVITNDAQRTASLLSHIHDACCADPQIERHIAGIHLEGPFISGEEGARGAHDRRYVIAPDYALFEKFQTASGGRIRIITVSPGWENAPSFIRKCVEHGVIVSIGHTNATAEQIRTAIASGATMSTHLGNGAALFLPRHPNFIWEQLASDELTAGIIADGHHIPPAFIRTVLRTKLHRVILVSDATMYAGMAPGVYDGHIGGKVELLATGRLQMRSNPAMLAGAALPLLSGVDFLVNHGLASLRTAWSMASVRVNRFVRISNASLVRAAHSDFVIFGRKRDHIVVQKVFKSGRQVFPE